MGCAISFGDLIIAANARIYSGDRHWLLKTRGKNLAAVT